MNFSHSRIRTYFFPLICWFVFVHLKSANRMYISYRQHGQREHGTILDVFEGNGIFDYCTYNTPNIIWYVSELGEADNAHWFCGIDRSFINKLPCTAQSCVCVYMHNVNKITNQTEECARNHFTNDICMLQVGSSGRNTNGNKNANTPYNTSLDDLQNHFMLDLCASFASPVFCLIPIFKKKDIPEYRSIGHVCHVDLVIRGAHAHMPFNRSHLALSIVCIFLF